MWKTTDMSRGLPTGIRCFQLRVAPLVAVVLLAAGCRYADATELHEAVAAGNTRTISALLERGADPNARDEDGLTPLHSAIFLDDTDSASLLLKAGADPNAKDQNGLTLLQYAAFNKPDAVRLLLRAGADPDVRDENGATPLHDAILFSYLDTANLLLKAGADPDARDDAGETPLHWASYHDQLDEANLLLRAGADPNARDDANETPLHYAAYRRKSVGPFENHNPERNLKVVRRLIAAGADPNARTRKGVTALARATDREIWPPANPKTIEFLRKATGESQPAGHTEQATGSAGSGTATSPEVYCLKRGDRLSKVAEKYLGDPGRWVDIARLNGIPLRGGTIRPGDCLKLPRK